MLYRKITQHIEDFLLHEPNKILLINGARQIGKSFVIRYVGKKLFKNYIEINLKEDSEGIGVFRTVRDLNDFHLQLGTLAGSRLGKKENTLVFLDEIQSYPHLLTMLKFLNQEGRYTYIASGSQLGVALSQTASVPIGSISIEQMYPLDFEEFLLAMGCAQSSIDGFQEHFNSNQPLNLSQHEYLMQQFKLFLLVGGLPESVNKFLENRNIMHVRKVQRDILNLYRIDASQYDRQRQLSIRRIYDMIPSNMENKKKRIIINRVNDKARHKQFSDFAEEFEYLINSGIAIPVRAISNPRFPLLESEHKNLLKLYMNDVGLLTGLLYDNNIQAVLQDRGSINLGSVYETVVAQELLAHGHTLCYYDNKQHGEVDFLIDDFNALSVLPIEVKSGKDYKVHSALDRFVATPDYHIPRAIVLSNSIEVTTINGITYLPIYYVMFLKRNMAAPSDLIIPPIEPPQ